MRLSNTNIHSVFSQAEVNALVSGAISLAISGELMCNGITPVFDKITSSVALYEPGVYHGVSLDKKHYFTPMLNLDRFFDYDLVTRETKTNFVFSGNLLVKEDSYVQVPSLVFSDFLEEHILSQCLTRSLLHTLNDNPSLAYATFQVYFSLFSLCAKPISNFVSFSENNFGVFI